MKERPILYSAPMVRAKTEGRKTQTRRIVKPQPFEKLKHNEPFKVEWFGAEDGFHLVTPDKTLIGKWSVDCPYGRPGDLLWGKETFAYGMSTKSGIAYRATSKWTDFEDGTPYDIEEIKWRPSIFMPRWASRILDEIVSIRVERLQDISEEDAKAEGTELLTEYIPKKVGFSYRQAYAGLWESINGPGSWDLNPYVWVIETKKVEK